MPPLLAVSLIGSLCIACQWFAWRFRLPAIVLLSVCGLILGPATSILNPQEIFGSNLRTLIAIAVAIILFDGGLGLRFKELKEMKRTVLQMVLIGAPLGWGLAAASCHYIAGLSWPVSSVFGGILVVTGPTVILPLLRQARLKSRPAAVLKWEGIVNDPLGALFAVIAFEYLSNPTLQIAPYYGFAIIAGKILCVAVLSFLLGRLIKLVFSHGQIPEFLKQPLILVLVLLTYASANLLLDESGLVAVTVLGITLANSNLANLEEMRRFKEYLSLLLVSLVFILITATLRLQDIEALNVHSLIFIALLLAVIRPLTVLFSSFRSGITREELLFIGWIAPRGVVCAAVSGLFGPELVKLGYADGNQIVPLAFAIVFATVVGHGFTLRPWGKRLGLISNQIEGLLIVGCNPFTVELAKHIKELDVPVLITDLNWHRLKLARQNEIPLYYGEILSEDAEFKLELNQYKEVLAATDNPSYNALVAARFAHEYGHEHVFRIAIGEEIDKHEKDAANELHVPAIIRGLSYDVIMNHLKEGWKIKAVKFSDEYNFSKYKEQYGDNILPLISLTSTKLSIYAGIHEKPAESGYTFISLVKSFTENTSGA